MHLLQTDSRQTKYFGDPVLVLNNRWGVLENKTGFAKIVLDKQHMMMTMQCTNSTRFSSSSFAGCHTIYIDQFEECVQLVRRDHPYFQEAFLMSCFIGGLREDIKHDVSGQRPRGILEAYWFAKVYENAAAAKKAYYQSNYRRGRGTFTHSNFKVPMNKQTNQPTQEKPVPHFNTDRPARQCWYCKEPWNREHRCRQGKTLHIL
jgi:hypothetical protein